MGLVVTIAPGLNSLCRSTKVRREAYTCWAGPSGCKEGYGAGDPGLLGLVSNGWSTLRSWRNAADN